MVRAYLEVKMTHCCILLCRTIALACYMFIIIVDVLLKMEVCEVQ